ncbi:MAG: ABC transporter ATP-binding protein [Candidatus Bathyarchaeia archaeon]
MAAIVDLRHVTKIYGSGPTAVSALKDVSLQVQRGEVVLVMGPSGSGKTTLLLVMGGLLKPTKGSARINTIEITKLSERELPKIRRENFGFVFQNPNLLSSLTALENVEVALNIANVKGEKANAHAKILLEKLGLSDRLNHQPDELSGGEQQRVAIARALANDPAIILADEPTANLDSKIGREVTELLCRVACEQDKSVVIVSHDKRIKYIANRILYLEDGRITKEVKTGKKQRTWRHKLFDNDNNSLKD